MRPEAVLAVPASMLVLSDPASAAREATVEPSSNAIAAAGLTGGDPSGGGGAKPAIAAASDGRPRPSAHHPAMHPSKRTKVQTLCPTEARGS
jgi:hypothetical protein